MEQTSQKKKWVIPHTYSIIFAIIILATIATYFVPAGEFERVEEVMDSGSTRVVVVDDSYHHVEQAPVNVFDMFKAIPLGMQEGARLI